MNKMQIAHDYALKQMESLSENSTMESLVSVAWQYADAMQAEADERNKAEAEQKRKEVREILNDANTFIDREWQPDWSQAPEWANWWAMDGFSNKANWYKADPFLDDDADEDSDEWNIVLSSSDTYKEAPSFDYQGNWKNSLRKRPQ